MVGMAHLALRGRGTSSLASSSGFESVSAKAGLAGLDGEETQAETFGKLASRETRRDG